MKICPKALLCFQRNPHPWEMHKLTIAAGGLRGIVPQGLVVPLRLKRGVVGTHLLVHHIVLHFVLAQKDHCCVRGRGGQ